MAEARRQEAWNHTSTVLAMVYNANRDPKKTRAASPRDFHPFEKQRRSGLPLTAANIGVLKAFTKKGREQ